MSSSYSVNNEHFDNSSFVAEPIVSVINSDVPLDVSRLSDNNSNNNVTRIQPLTTDKPMKPIMTRRVTTDVRNRSQSCVRGSTMSFHSLNYFVQVPGGLCCCAGTVDKQILHDANGIFRPGMNAIMGPTGSGKTTLLDVLAGRTEQYGINGYILVDGQRRPKNFKCMTGYVVQDDVVMGTLTVRENIMFSANLRLPQSVSHAEKCNRVTEALDELGLLKCADSKVGTEFIRGVSGGERKRCNIGMELIISPSILFLDEPTTGLDASTANAVMQLLHRLSLRGRTIIFSIHQPRFAIFKLFDRLSLLAAGRTIYHGPAAEALQFFSEMGYECEEHNNPPDFFLDVINGDSSAVRCTQELSNSETKQELTRNSDVTMDIEMNDSLSGRSRSLAEQLSTKYNESTWFHRCAEELKPILGQYLQVTQTGVETIETDVVQYATSFPNQMKYVARRTFLNLARNPQTSILTLGFNILMGVIIGIIFLQLDLNEAGIQSRIGLLFFVCVNNMMSSLPSIEIFIRERVIFVHESASGFYRVSAYFFSKVICDLLPMRIIPLIFYCIIVYFMTGLQMAAGKFFLFMLVLFLTSICASGVAFSVSATIGVFAIANLICVLVYIITMIFGGLLVNIANLGEWIKWIQWLSMIRYGLNMLMINEMKELTFCDNPMNITMPSNYSCQLDPNVKHISGASYLTKLGIQHDTMWEKWQNVMALILLGLGVMTLAYVQLRRMKKLK